MPTYIRTSMFPNGFPAQAAEVFLAKIGKRGKFAFIASEFQKDHGKTDAYFRFFLEMFEQVGIRFASFAPRRRLHITGKFIGSAMERFRSCERFGFPCGGSFFVSL